MTTNVPFKPSMIVQLNVIVLKILQGVRWTHVCICAICFPNQNQIAIKIYTKREWWYRYLRQIKSLPKTLKQIVTNDAHGQRIVINVPIANGAGYALRVVYQTKTVNIAEFAKEKKVLVLNAADIKEDATEHYIKVTVDVFQILCNY